uniref:Uncharacterized protein n=1 Tax=Chromera velia CCMP2878 TaxID=1169474 RepID=A0A0G4H2U5_9ALVE|eukprot:Cvel_5613.t1-p1 / transcript=Cvel_5613.t1 / gene=Cvel_5613 / organism=Chromera_velia_CCMP2878 / gene_product=hypothetical protein / transcript_product=hypothetical protein / location=Cvel_scaffold264:51464-55865(+) / protein_length=751 / sequence_SO=supercontig / SO=protein_coding / is_pseudo=false
MGVHTLRQGRLMTPSTVMRTRSADILLLATTQPSVSIHHPVQMNRNGGEHHEGGRSKGDERKDAEAENLKEETARWQNMNKAFFVILKHTGLSAQMLSGLAKDRNSFGAAWLLIWIYSKNYAFCKVSVAPPQAIDLSGARGLTPENIFLFLAFLPVSVDDMKLDASAVKGPALPLFVQFFKRLQAVREGEGGRRDHPSHVSIGSRIARIFSHTLRRHRPDQMVVRVGEGGPGLRKFSFAGNRLGTEGVQALVGALRNHEPSSLRSLDLERTGLNGEELAILCKGLNQKSHLSLETLNLSGIRLRAPAMQTLSCVLCAASLPSLRVLLLKECQMRNPEIEELGSVLGRGDLPNLETLDLEWNCFTSLESFSKCLRGDKNPFLKNLNLVTLGVARSASWAAAFFHDLGSPGFPPLENVQIHINTVEEDDLPENAKDGVLRELAAGRHPAVRTLSLDVNARQLTLFLRQLSVSFEGLDVNLDVRGGDGEQIEEALKLVGNAVETGRLRTLRRFTASSVSRGSAGLESVMAGVVASQEGLPELLELDLSISNVGGMVGALGTALKSGKLRKLSKINLWMSSLTSDGMRRFAKAVRGGALYGVSFLELCYNSDVEEEAWTEFMHAVAESSEGAPTLRYLGLSSTNAEKVGGSVLSALASGKLPLLEGVGPQSSFLLDEEGVQRFSEAVRRGRFPTLLKKLKLGLKVPGLRFDSLITAIAENEKGLPSFVASLNLTGGWACWRGGTGFSCGKSGGVV